MRKNQWLKLDGPLKTSVEGGLRQMSVPGAALIENVVLEAMTVASVRQKSTRVQGLTGKLSEMLEMRFESDFRDHSVKKED